MSPSAETPGGSILGEALGPSAPSGPPGGASARARRALLAVAVGTAAVGNAGYLFLPDASAPTRSALLLASLAAFLVLIWTPLRSSLTMPVVLVAGLVLLVGAVVARPAGTDLWYYQLYGRIVVEEGASPYKHSPAEYPDDPVLARTGGFWDGVRSEYGPGLVATAVVVAAATGDHPLAARLAWQGLAAAATGAAILLVAARTRDPAAVALVALNPVVVQAVVNPGHNDAVIGLLILGGVLLATSRRDVPAALCMVGAALIKAPAGLALGALLIWIACRRGLRAAIGPALGSGLALVAAVTLAGGRATLEPMLAARDRTNAFTPWNLLRDNGLRPFTGRLEPPLGEVSAFLPTLAVGTTLLLAGLLLRKQLEVRWPGPAVGVVMSAWLLCALYTSPWSIGWVLPVLALSPRSRTTLLMATAFTVLLFANEFGNTFHLGYLLEHPAGADLVTRVRAYLVSASIVTFVAVTSLLLVDALRGPSGRPPQVGADLGGPA